MTSAEIYTLYNRIALLIFQPEWVGPRFFSFSFFPAAVLGIYICHEIVSRCRTLIFFCFWKWTQDFESCSWQAWSKTTFKIKIPVRRRRARTQRIQRIPSPDIFYKFHSTHRWLIWKKMRTILYSKCCALMVSFLTCVGATYFKTQLQALRTRPVYYPYRTLQGNR